MDAGRREEERESCSCIVRLDPGPAAAPAYAPSPRTAVGRGPRAQKPRSGLWLRYQRRGRLERVRRPKWQCFQRCKFTGRYSRLSMAPVFPVTELICARCYGDRGTPDPHPGRSRPLKMS